MSDVKAKMHKTRFPLSRPQGVLKAPTSIRRDEKEGEKGAKGGREVTGGEGREEDGKSKPDATKPRIHQSKEMYNNTK